jgi:hypothetical protein
MADVLLQTVVFDPLVLPEITGLMLMLPIALAFVQFPVVETV